MDRETSLGRSSQQPAFANWLILAGIATLGVILLWAACSVRPDRSAIGNTQGEGSQPDATAVATLPFEAGRRGYLSSCAACHGTRGQGMPRQGPALVDSPLLRTADDEALLQFLIDGRTADDPNSIMRLPMPPRAGNPWLTDEELRVIAAYTRQLKRDAASR